MTADELAVVLGGFADRIENALNQSRDYNTQALYTAPNSPLASEPEAEKEKPKKDPKPKKDEGSGAGIGDVVSGAFGKILGPVTSAVGAITELASKISVFVAAFSPTTMAMFNDALENVNATIGVALAPTVEVLTGTLREFSGILDPLMRQLEPLFTQMAELLGQALTTSLRLVASVLSLLTPVLQAVLDAYSAMYQIVFSLVDILTAVVRTFQSLIGSVDSGFQAMMDELVKALRLMIVEVVSLVAMIAKWLGMDSFVSELSASFAKLADETEKASAAMNKAARDARIESLEAIMNKFTTAAFVASGATRESEGRKEEIEFLRKIAENTGKISNISRAEELKAAATDTAKSIATSGVDKATHSSFGDRSLERAKRGALAGSVIPFFGPIAGAAAAVGSGAIADLFD